jgi:hypothetical protein
MLSRLPAEDTGTVIGNTVMPWRYERGKVHFENAGEIRSNLRRFP